MRISYFTKAVGVTFEDRQSSIARMPATAKLKLRREPNNEYDANAIAIDSLIDNEWLPIGYIAKEKNKRLAEEMDKGTKVKVSLSEVTGGIDDKALGVNIAIEYEHAGETQLEEIIPVIGTGYVMFDRVNHIYFDEEGNQMISGSKYEDMYSPDVDFSYAAKAMSKSTGIKPDMILDLWKENGNLSAEYGTAMHQGMEMYFKSHQLMKQLDGAKERPHTATTYMPQAVGEVVDQYIADRDEGFADRCSPEVFVRYGNRCGYVDLIEQDDKQVIDLHDYKFIKQLKRVKYQHYGTHNKYTLQQNFYREIIEANGYKVRSMTLDIYKDGSWEKSPVERIKLEY